MWALGSVTFELFVNLPIMLFFNPKLKMYDEKFIEGDVYLPKMKNLSLELVDFLSLCLQFNPENRPTIKQLQEHPFLTKSSQQPVPEFLFKQYEPGLFSHYSMREGLTELWMVKIDTLERFDYITESQGPQDLFRQREEMRRKATLVDEKHKSTSKNYIKDLNELVRER